MAYTWSSILDQLIAGKPVPEEVHLWARAHIADGQATPGQQGIYHITQQPGWNLLENLASNLDHVESLIRNTPEQLLTISPSPNEWPVQLIIGHLADNELVNAVRIRLVLTEDCPNLIGYDSDPWAKRFFGLEDCWTAFQRWTLLRRNLLRLCATLSENDWQRTGYLSYRGEESLRVLLGVLAGHDFSHINQIEAVLRAVRSPRRNEGAVSSHE